MPLPQSATSRPPFRSIRSAKGCSKPDANETTRRARPSRRSSTRTIRLPNRRLSYWPHSATRRLPLLRRRETLPGIEGASPSAEACGSRQAAGAVTPFAAALQPKGASVSPTTRPPVSGAVLDDDQRVGRLRITPGIEVVVAIDGRVKATRARLNGKPERVAQPRGVNA